MGCCSSKETGGANAFYGDGDTSKAEERQLTPKPTRAPSRAPSRADLFYNDGDEVEEKEDTTSCFGSKSKSSKGAKSKALSRSTKNEDSSKSSRGTSGNAGGSAANEGGTAGGTRAWWENLEQDPKKMNKYDAILYNRKQRIGKLLDRNPRQRAMQDSHDDQEEEQRRKQEHAEDREAYLKKFKKDDEDKSSCFAGLCKPKSKRVGASNFHDQ